MYLKLKVKEMQLHQEDFKCNKNNDSNVRLTECIKLILLIALKCRNI